MGSVRAATTTTNNANPTTTIVAALERFWMLARFWLANLALAPAAASSSSPASSSEAVVAAVALGAAALGTAVSVAASSGAGRHGRRREPAAASAAAQGPHCAMALPLAAAANAKAVDAEVLDARGRLLSGAACAARPVAVAADSSGNGALSLAALLELVGRTQQESAASAASAGPDAGERSGIGSYPATATTTQTTLAQALDAAHRAQADAAAVEAVERALRRSATAAAAAAAAAPAPPATTPATSTRAANEPHDDDDEHPFNAGLSAEALAAGAAHPWSVRGAILVARRASDAQIDAVLDPVGATRASFRVYTRGGAVCRFDRATRQLLEVVVGGAGGGVGSQAPPTVAAAAPAASAPPPPLVLQPPTPTPPPVFSSVDAACAAAGRMADDDVTAADPHATRASFRLAASLAPAGGDAALAVLAARASGAAVLPAACGLASCRFDRATRRLLEVVPCQGFGGGEVGAGAKAGEKAAAAPAAPANDATTTTAAADPFCYPSLAEAQAAARRLSALEIYRADSASAAAGKRWFELRTPFAVCRFRRDDQGPAGRALMSVLPTRSATKGRAEAEERVASLPTPTTASSFPSFAAAFAAAAAADDPAELDPYATRASFRLFTSTHALRFDAATRALAEAVPLPKGRFSDEAAAKGDNDDDDLLLGAVVASVRGAVRVVGAKGPDPAPARAFRMVEGSDGGLRTAAPAAAANDDEFAWWHAEGSSPSSPGYKRRGRNSAR